MFSTTDGIWDNRSNNKAFWIESRANRKLRSMDKPRSLFDIQTSTNTFGVYSLFEWLDFKEKEEQWAHRVKKRKSRTDKIIQHQVCCSIWTKAVPGLPRYPLWIKPHEEVTETLRLMFNQVVRLMPIESDPFIPKVNDKYLHFCNVTIFEERFKTILDGIKHI